MSNGLGYQVDDAHAVMIAQRDKDYLRAYNKGIAHALALSEMRMSYMFPGPTRMPDGMRLVGGGSSSMDGTTLANANYASLTTGGKVNRLKKAQKWLGFSKDVADAGLDIAEKAGPMVAMGAGKVNRMKKAKKWTGFAKGLAEDAMAMAGAGKVNRMRKAKKWTGFAKGLAEDALAMASPMIEGAGKPKRTSAWITHVKKYASEHNIPYKEAMSKAKATYKK